MPAAGVAQHRVEPALGLAGEQRDAERLRLLQFRRHLRQHGEAARDVEAADRHLARRAARRRRAMSMARGKLVGLHADQADQPEAAAAAMSRAMRSGRMRVLVSSSGDDVDVDIVAEHAAAAAIERQAVQHGQRVRRNRRAQPLDDIAVIVVMRRLDQVEREPSGHTAPRSAPLGSVA